jgi:uncharacterized protein YqeY
MISLSQIEQDLTSAMKAKDQVAVDTLRGLKTRMQNQKIAKGKDLSEADIMSLIRSEVKKRKEAVAAFMSGGRQEMADKEAQEAGILEKYLPQQMPETELVALVEKVLLENSFTAKDFGAAMGKLKALAGDKADGAALARVLKEKLK